MPREKQQEGRGEGKEGIVSGEEREKGRENDGGAGGREVMHKRVREGW